MVSDKKGNLIRLGNLAIRTIVLGGIIVWLSGCRTNPQRANIEKRLMSETVASQPRREVIESYRLACPDVIDVRIEGRPEFDTREVVGPDGCIRLGRYGKVRLEGLTLGDAAGRIAERLGTQPTAVQVRVADFASRHLILIGEVVGRQRTVPYQGPETVLEVLQRSGGITAGAEPTEVYVVRSHFADLQRPEVFHIDLQSIVLRQDHRTNIRVLPYDQIHVGETRQARVEKCIPPWLRPLHQTIWDMLPNGAKPKEREHSFSQFIRGWFGRAEDDIAEAADSP